MRVVGIDPGVQKTGIGIIDAEPGLMKPVFFETFHTNAKLSRYEKLSSIFEHVSQVIDEFRPEALALENIFFGQNFKVAIRLGEARSAAILAATLKKITICEYLPTRVKEAICGNGRAAKQQVQRMVMGLLNIVELPEEDAADALAIAMCHVQSDQSLLRSRMRSK
ncbi:MAG: crossover junction endodeoxyribonuclease RuvC [Candidatus Omnitrophica bacterium]|nr:crossover junction endodeoxyribonuclease RuvC [Candidatus Omnitrophota bacterium]